MTATADFFGNRSRAPRGPALLLGERPRRYGARRRRAV